MANEAILYGAYVSCLLFVGEYLPDEELKYNIGFVFVGIIGIVVVSNLIFTFYRRFIDVLDDFKRSNLSGSPKILSYRRTKD